MTSESTTAHRSRIVRTLLWVGRTYWGMSLIGKGIALLVAYYAAKAVYVLAGASVPYLVLTVQVAVMAGIVCLGLYFGRNTQVGGPVWRVTARGLSWLSGWLSGLLRFRRRERPNPWWPDVEARLMWALTKAGAVKVEEGHQPPRITLLSFNDDDDDPTERWTFRLPGDLVFSNFAKHHEHIAIALGIPGERVIITRGHLGNEATITIPPVAVEVAPRDWARPETIGWDQPLVIGRDIKGNDVAVPTVGTGALLFGGKSGSGKTSGMFVIAAPYALDPKALIYVVDGKSSKSDWGPLAHRTEQTLYQANDPDGTRFLALLQEVEGIMKARSLAGDGDCTEPGILLILEEYTNFTAAIARVDSKAAKAAVALVESLTTMGRASHVMVMIASQKPSAEMISTLIRDQAQVSIAMMMKAGYKMVLGDDFDQALPKPKGKGQSLVVVDGEDDRFVYFDYMSKDAWKALCRSLPARQRSAVPEPVDPSTDAAPAVETDDHDLPHAAAPADEQAPEPLHSVPDPAPVTDSRDAVLAVVRADGGTVKVKRIIEATGLPRSTVSWAITKLVTAGELEPVTGGGYTLTGAAGGATG